MNNYGQKQIFNIYQKQKNALYKCVIINTNVKLYGIDRVTA